jgi:hypothetical protein
MQTLTKANIIFEDGYLDEIPVGLVHILGESGGAVVRVTAPNFHSRRFATVDTLTRATFTRKGDTFTISGQSAYLADSVGVTAAESVVEIQVTPEPGCEDCIQ